MARQDWSRLIQETMERATPFTRNVFGRSEKMMSEEELMDFFAKARMAVVSTVSPSGVPHSTCVSFVTAGGGLYFRVAPESTLNRNLTRKPRIAVAVVEPPFQVNVLIQGSTRFLPEDGPDTDDVRAGFREKFSFNPEILAEVMPSRVIAYKAG